MSTEVIDAVRAALSAQGDLTIPVGDLGDEADLFEAGLSSLSAVRVLLSIEDAFDIEFADESLTREMFSSVSALARKVAEARGDST